MARKPSQICITGTGRIRTYVERIQQIYNLSPLTTQPLSHSNIILLVFCSRLIIKKVLPCIHPFSCIPSWYPFPAPFQRKGVKRKVFRRKTLFPLEKFVSFQKYYLKGCIFSNTILEGRDTTQGFRHLVSLPCPFSGKRGEKEGFPNKNGIFVLVFRRKTCVPSKTTFLLENLCPFLFYGTGMDTSFLTWYPFPAPFLGKGVKRGSFLTWYPFPAPFLGKGVKRKVHKFSNLVSLPKVFEGRATTQVFLWKT